MESVNRNIIWTIIASLIGLGIVLLIFVSFQRTTTTKAEVKTQLETMPEQMPEIASDGMNKVKPEEKAEVEAKKSAKALDERADVFLAEQRMNSTKLYFITLGTALLIGFTCFSVGAFCGFLFGIPRIISSSSTQVMDETSKNLIFHNDNLVQISDWLTKIIVGVGLTQIANVPKILNDLGEYLGPSFTTNFDNLPVADSTKAIAVSTVLYFLILGFIACYLWTRFQFSNMLRETMKVESQHVNQNK